ncbi:hypothetical protein V8E54_013174 [Elaphomyces granulatus]
MDLGSEQDSKNKLYDELQKVCQNTLTATKQARIDLAIRLRKHQTSESKGNGDEGSEQDLSNQLAAEQQARAMKTDDNSIAMQGTLGVPKDIVVQSFGKMTVTNDSRAFQGQMSGDDFANFMNK